MLFVHSVSTYQHLCIMPRGLMIRSEPREAVAMKSSLISQQKSVFRDDRLCANLKAKCSHLIALVTGMGSPQRQSCRCDRDA